MSKMKTVSLILFGLLFAWYSLIFIGVPKLLIEGRGSVLGLEGLLELFLILILSGYFAKWKFTDALNLFVSLIWGYMQYTSHWKSLFGAPVSDMQIKRYYQYFSGTLRIFPESSTVIIPDAYHMILDLLLLINICLSVTKIIQCFILKNDIKIIN